MDPQQHSAPQHPVQAQPYNAEPEALRNLMVNYIPTTVDEMQLRTLFERFGPIESVKIVCDRETRQSRGFGFIKYQSAASAQHAINDLNGFNILNKRLRVALAASGNQRPRSYQNNNGGGNVNYYGGGFGGYPPANPYAQQQMMAMYGQYMVPPQAGAPQQPPPRN